MFALLLAFTSRWTVFEAASLRNNPLNARSLLQQQRIERGSILAADRTVLARSVRAPASGSSEVAFERTYPTGSAFANAVGYSYIDLGRTGLERSRNAALEGQTRTNLQSILDQLQGKRTRGDTVFTTLEPGGQQVANEALAGHEGAVVALEPRSGAVRVMASVPSFDPNALRSQRAYRRLASGGGGRPLVNRATQFGYAPGSTFKVITATAAIDTGAFTPESTVSGRDNVRISGVPLQNDENASYGQLTLTQGLTKSVNTVWAQVAVRVGKRTLGRYMSRFGFDRTPQLDYPSDEMSVSGEHGGGGEVDDGSRRQRRHGHLGADPGRAGGGQDGNGGDADRQRDQQRLVHRIRASRRSHRGDRGHPARGTGTGSCVRRAGGAAGDRKAPAWL